MMHPVKALAVGLLAWPAAEIVAFLCVAAALGFVNAILMIVLTSFAGVLVLRHFSNGAQQVDPSSDFLRAQVWQGRMAPSLGGAFLLIPGFITSALGVAILFPVSRRWLLAGFRHLFPNRRQASDPGIVDLTPDEWRPLAGDKLPRSGSSASE